jgi:hypothetical protein
LSERENDAGLTKGAESAIGDLHFVVAGRKEIDTIGTLGIALDGASQARVLVTGGDVRSHDHSAGSILDGTEDIAGDLLSVKRDREESEKR